MSKWLWMIVIGILLAVAYVQYGDRVAWDSFLPQDPEKAKLKSLKSEIDKRTLHINSSKSVVTKESVFRDVFENKIINSVRSQRHIILLLKGDEKIPLTYSEEKIKERNVYFIIIDNEVTLDSKSIPKNRIISIKQ